MILNGVHKLIKICAEINNNLNLVLVCMKLLMYVSLTCIYYNKFIDNTFRFTSLFLHNLWHIVKKKSYIYRLGSQWHMFFFLIQPLKRYKYEQTANLTKKNVKNHKNMNKLANYGIKFAFDDIMYTVSHEEARVSIASNYYAYNVKI